MKTPLILAALFLTAPACVLAETKPAPKKPSATAARTTAKASAQPSAKQQQQQRQGKASTKSRGKATARVEPTKRDELHSMAAQLAAGQRAADRALTPTELALADRVQIGRIACELGNVVTLTADPKSPGHFDLELQKVHYRMTPVASSTGAIRLEDPQAGAVWLQLGNKSMLMNQKLGQRLADECQSPDQLQVAESLKRTPGPMLFDSAPPAVAELPVSAAADATMVQPGATTAIARRPKLRQ